eukprot:gnl/MRDRNA2_/MRDRNA2_97985_c0_seq1.p1 gnl/MRDRNA2_/MRDRNA2_97985_c0~~gnl/MRDRNA2_/MRDRNA2_97985_c0_seq1.p1  ORF type:complete len:174 (+),score=30.60 gnl/MRDRNA2_/MRDRNA2_97985_c0_seq1:59-580(+)
MATPWIQMLGYRCRCATRAGVAVRRTFSSHSASEFERHSVFGAGQEDTSVFQATTHTYRAQEQIWRSHNLQLHENTRTKDEHSLRKKLRHHARARGWMEAAEFLVAFIDSEGETLNSDELRDWERLMACDDMFLMRLVAGLTSTPEELDTAVLQKLKSFFEVSGPSKILANLQ